MPATAGTPIKKRNKPTKRPTTQDFVYTLLRMISNGKLDKHLQLLSVRIRERQVALRELEAFRSMETLSDPGTRVRIKYGRIKPQYLQGHTGEVVERPFEFRSSPNVIHVKLDAGKVRRYGPVVGVPASSLEAE